MNCSSKSKSGATTSPSYEVQWQKKEVTRGSKERMDSTVSASLLAWSTSPDARRSLSSQKFLSPIAASCSSRAATVSTKKKTTTSLLPSCGHRDGLGMKSSVETSSSSSVFMFMTHDEKRAASSERSWSMGKSKRSTPRKERRNSKSSSSMLSNSRAGTRVVAACNTHFLLNVNEESEVAGPDASTNIFAFTTHRNKSSRSLASKKGSGAASFRNKATDQVPAVETAVFDFDKNFSRDSPPTFPVSLPSTATTCAAPFSFVSESIPTVDPLVNCARAVLQDCIRTRKMEQSMARKRSIERCIDGEVLENKGWHYESVSKPWQYDVVSPGSCSSSDDELSELLSANQSFCTDKSEQGCNSKLAKEEIYRQILAGDNELSCSPEFQCFSPLIEEKGIPIEVRYQLPLALGTANETSKECTICQLRYGIGDHIVTLPCQHFFHACCVDKWLWNHTSCPLCRTEVALDQEAEVCATKHNFTECSPVDQERIRCQMRSSSQHADFRPVIPVESNQLELEMSRMAIDEDLEVEDEPSYIVCPTPRFASSAQDK
ncbi:unnamed protein product [Peronospora belbahrii]|uniref:RING-type domain-containing protein n=1 Tax=Peronospora belbahrii TaxID=622444 RepID=A0ABN8CZK0_9STRA|nr:unnamed protein product [Peronospora belbahrii]